MPRKVNKRKAIQAAKRKALEAEAARKSRRWPGTRREPAQDRRVGMIAHHNASAALAALLLGIQAVKVDRGND